MVRAKKNIKTVLIAPNNTCGWRGSSKYLLGNYYEGKYIKRWKEKLTINNQNNNSKKVGFCLTENLSFRKTQRKTILAKIFFAQNMIMLKWVILADAQVFLVKLFTNFSDPFYTLVWYTDLGSFQLSIFFFLTMKMVVSSFDFSCLKIYIYKHIYLFFYLYFLYISLNISKFIYIYIFI